MSTATRPRARQIAAIEPPALPPETDELQSLMDGAVRGSLLGVEKTVAGRKLRPITMASVALLQEINSPLINGVTLDAVPNLLLECCIFVCLQTCTLKEAKARVFGERSILLDKALEIADEVPANETKDVIDTSMEILKDSISTQVKASSKGDGKPSSPMGNG